MSLVASAARSMFEAEWVGTEEKYPEADKETQWRVFQRRYTKLSHAALIQIRDATPAMLTEGAAILYREDDGDITQTELAARVFRGMCDAALAEGVE